MLTAHELCRQSALTYRELDNWVRTGVLPVATYGHETANMTALRLPGTVPGGSGYPRYFTHKTARIATVLKRLRPLLGLDALRNVYAGLDALNTDNWPLALWVTPDGTLNKRRPRTTLAIWVDLTGTEEYAQTA